MLLTISDLAAQAFQASELRAAYLYNFAQLITWPSETFLSPNDSFLICLLEVSTENQSAMAKLDARTYHDHPIKVQVIQDLSRASECQMLYTDGRHGLSTQRILRTLDGLPILIIDSSLGAASAGASIEFIEVEGRLRWILNLDAIQDAQLRVSSKLIEISRRVIGEKR